MKIIVSVFTLMLVAVNSILFAQNNMLRDPNPRKDYVNVFYNLKYTLFDYWSDEPVFPDLSGTYNIFYATNENKTPQSFKGTGSQLTYLIAYKFKSYSNCQNWCNNIIFNSESSINNNDKNSLNIRGNKYADKSNQIKEILIPYKDGKEYGYKNLNGDVMIKPKFDSAFPFYSYNNIPEISAVIINNNKYFIIDNEGKKINRHSFEYISNDIHKKLRLFSEDKKIGFLSRSGKIITTDLYDLIYSCVKNKSTIREAEYYFLKKGNNFTFSHLVSENENIFFEDITKSSFQQIFDLNLNNITPNEFSISKYDYWTDDNITLQFPTNHFIVNDKSKYSYLFKDSSDKFNLKYSFDSILSIENINKSIPTFRIIKDNKYGLMDFNGKILINPSFDFIEIFKKDFANTIIDKKYGIIDFNGKTILENELDSLVPINNGYQKIFKNGKIGILDSLMQIIVPINYDKVRISNSDFIYVEKNGLLGLYYKNKKILDPFYNFISERDENGFIKFRKEKYYGLLRDVEAIGYLNIIIEPEFDSLEIYDKYLEGFKNSKVGRFDLFGKVLIECIYDSINNFENTQYLKLVKTGKSGLSDSFGKIIIPIQFDFISSIRSNIIKTILGTKMGFYNLINDIKVDPKFDDLVDDFIYTQFIKTKFNNKFGLISLTGNELLNPIYDDIIGFDKSLTLITVKNNGLVGLIKNNGQIVCDLKFQFIYESSIQGSWITKLNNKYGLYSDLGSEILKPTYDNIGEFKNNLASIKLNNKFGIINSEGVEIVKPTYDYYFEFEGDKASVSLNGKNLKIDKSGDEIFNDFNQFSLSELTRDGKPVPKIISEKVEKILSEVTSQTLVNQYLGKKFDADAYFKKAAEELKVQEEESLNGLMNKKQSEEFYKIVYESTNKYVTNLKLINSFFKNSDQYESRNSNNDNRRYSGKESNSQNSDQCNFCKPYDSKGLFIQDFNPSTRTYSGGRYILRPGYKVCETCFGTGDCRIKCSGGKRDCPGICDENGTCQTCKGDRFVLCRDCKGSGKK